VMKKCVGRYYRLGGKEHSIQTISHTNEGTISQTEIDQSKKNTRGPPSSNEGRQTGGAHLKGNVVHRRKRYAVLTKKHHHILNRGK